MPYSHFHDWSYHRHRQRRKGGYHHREIRRRQKPWRVVFMLVLAAMLFGGGAVFAMRFNSPDGDGSATVLLPAATGAAPTRALTPVSPVSPSATLMAGPTLSLTPAPLASPSPTVATTPTRLPTPAPTPTPVAPELRQLDGKRYMLELINEARANAGLNPVALGYNIAAQLHAEISLANCVASHWGIDGLKPYMRYSLAGGYQSNGENGSGSDYCVRAADGYRAEGSIKARVDEAMDGWMDSAGHRRTILTPEYQKVNIGIAYDRYNTVMYQHFEGDYVEYATMPSLANGILSLSGTTQNGVRFRSKSDLGVQIYYDPPPHELTRGQVSRTYCYGNGRQLAALREPLFDGSYWTTDEFTETYEPCPNPYDVPADAPPARSAREANRLWDEAYAKSQTGAPQTITVPWITASEWRAGGETFAIRADLSDLLRERGNGVYSVVIWGTIAGANAVISEYSIFHGITPPDTYSDDN